MEFLLAILAGVISYLFGSVSFAVVFSKLFANKDVRKYGSHNAGMTNVVRVFGVLPGIFTFLFDTLKGFLAVVIGWNIFSYCHALNSSDMFLPLYGGYFCAVLAMLGHVFPIFFNFKGGKAVTVCLGVMFACNWYAAVIAIFVFILLILVTNMVSISSMTAVASMLVTVPNFRMSSTEIFVRGGNAGINAVILIFNLIMVSLVIIVHRENIKRIINKTENKVFKKRDKNG